jgi:hypothetical protein
MNEAGRRTTLGLKLDARLLDVEEHLREGDVAVLKG